MDDEAGALDERRSTRNRWAEIYANTVAGSRMEGALARLSIGDSAIQETSCEGNADHMWTDIVQVRRSSP